MLVVLVTWLPPRLISRPAVGIIRLNEDIWAGSLALVEMQIEEARADDAIKAVVMQIDSPGGEVVASQALYLALQNLRQEMPVVGSIDNMAASGGYYVALATDPILAKPSSNVGNIGVWAFAPEELSVNDVVLSSGPFKMTGSNRAEFLRELESIKRDFVGTTTSQRGERLQLTPAELAQGLLYLGREARDLGLIDEIGAERDAIEAAARQAHIANYEVVDLSQRVWDKLEEEEGWLSRTWIGTADPATGERQLPPGIYLLYDPTLRGVL